MAFTVETGTGSPSSNSYASVADAQTHFTDRGLTALAAKTTAELQAALIAATDYIDSKFSFSGSRVSATQALSWPRSGSSDGEEGIDIADNTIPAAIRRATIVLAGKYLEGTTLLEDLDRGGGVSSVKVGPVAISYSPDADPSTVFGITGLLKGLFAASDGTSRVQPDLVSELADSGFSFTKSIFDNNG